MFAHELYPTNISSTGRPDRDIATHDRTTTTAGSLALAGSVAPRDAFLVQQRRAPRFLPTISAE